jgi:hypothetical protein
MPFQIRRHVVMPDPRQVRTFSVAMPRSTHREPATCEQVACPKFLSGWVTTVAPDSPELQTLALACRGEVDGHRRGYGRVATTAEGFLEYWFPPGQPCLSASTHSVPNGEPPIFRHKLGDHRATFGSVVTHRSADSWVAEFGEHQQRLADQQQRFGERG